MADFTELPVYNGVGGYHFNRFVSSSSARRGNQAIPREGLCRQFSDLSYKSICERSLEG